ncbi:DNA-packaging protein, partial [Enterococcus avium]|uniref:YopX family protein n=1 Tax=Enterococcus avium TaxID=33945 RepID=UPI0017B16B8D
MIPKFRAWDKQGKTMNDVESINFDWNRIFLLDWCVACKFEDIELMQSTGLKDKNSVEIFEGDIVKVSVHNGFDYYDNEVCVVRKS